MFPWLHPAADMARFQRYADMLDSSFDVSHSYGAVVEQASALDGLRSKPDSPTSASNAFALKHFVLLQQRRG